MKTFSTACFLILLLAGHFYWLHGHVAPAGPGGDATLTQARLLATEQRVTFRPESSIEYIGPGWLDVQPGRFASRTPPGLPVLMAALWRQAGPEAVFLLNPALATASLLFLFLLCRPWVGSGLALAAALILAAHPLANQSALGQGPLPAATLLLLAGLWLLDAWGRRPVFWKALFAGLLLGAAPCFRLAEAAAGLGVAFFLLLQAARLPGRRGQALLVLLGAALPLGLLLAYLHVIHGGVSKGVLAGLERPSLEGLLRTWEPLLEALMTGGVGLFFAFGLAGLAGMLVQPALRPTAACLGLVIAGITALHAASASGPEQALGRLLPALPLYLLPALWFFQLLGPGRVPRAALLVLLALHLGRAIPDSIAVLERERAAAESTAEANAWLERVVPPGSILIGDGTLHAQIRYTGNWKLAEKERVWRALTTVGLAVPHPELERWAGPSRAVYWAGTRGEADSFRGWALGIQGLEPAGTIPLEEPLELFLLRR